MLHIINNNMKLKNFLDIPIASESLQAEIGVGKKPESKLDVSEHIKIGNRRKILTRKEKKR
ncbi:hypothetical protein [Bacteroidetes bacterium endosymbiont of Geopemphigus sp.]|uniref:hypothetical protein n=1 Tax=Bacteroidetes bacterium endosymbiont of Geopemphigus sp. TaxID=2047937 RepID=UPI000CD25D58|nr:hypothetical protein [Bacteroidetes bacterium endosymbiont of Geopemphigus sp.]